MANSTIGSFVILGPQGPSGPIGPTGETGNTGNTGPTGPTGDYGRYITTILPSPDKIIFTLSDGTTKEVFGNFRGATSEFFISGITSSFELNDNEILHDYGSIISSYDDSTKTLYVKGLSASGSLYLTEDNDYIYIHTNLSEQNSQKDIATLQSRTLIYLKENFKISSTSVGVSYDDGIYYNGTLVYDDVGSGNGRAKLNASAKINYIGPIFKNENPIYLNADEAGVFYLSTPIGIAGITGTFRKNESISLTIIPESENIWHFPSNIYFEEAENYLTCGKSVINLISTDQGETWLATVAARGFDVSTGTCTISNTLGSCCYQGVDFSIKCLDYTSKETCDSLAGTFSPLKSCDTACGTVGICCSNGKCIENSNPSECEAFGGRFFLGLTCGAYNNDPNSTNFGTRLCPNNCEQDGLVSCCKDGVCLGEDYTKLLCEHLGGVAFDKTCVDAKCCEQNIGIGPCCTSTGCRELTKAECDAVVGIYMGEGFACEEINCECFDINEEVGACCDGGTCSQKYQSQCTGKWIGGSCQPNSCDTETIACCYCNNGMTTCLDTTPVICTNLNGQNQGNSCSNVNCSIQNCNNPPSECDTSVEPIICDDFLNEVLPANTYIKFNTPYNATPGSSSASGTGKNHTSSPTTYSNQSILSPGINNFAIIENTDSSDWKNGSVNKYIFRSPIAVKDFYIPKTSYHTTNGSSISISDDNARFCMTIDVDPDLLKSFRIYLLRTGFPKFFSHNYAALLKFKDSLDNQYEFLDNRVVNSNLKENRTPNYQGIQNGRDTNFENGDIIIKTAAGNKVFLPGTYKLRRTLNNPLYGLVRFNYPSIFNSGSIPSSVETNENYDLHLTKFGLHMMGTEYLPSYGYTFAAFADASTNQNIYAMYDNGSFGIKLYMPMLYTNETTRPILSISGKNGSVFQACHAYDQTQISSGNWTLYDYTDPNEQTGIMRTSLKYQPSSDLRTLLDNKNPQWLTSSSSVGYYSYDILYNNTTLTYNGFLCGYYTPGYKKINMQVSSGSITSEQGNTFGGIYSNIFYKHLSKKSLNFANTFRFNGSNNESNFLDFNEEIDGIPTTTLNNSIAFTGHPWTVDLENPGYTFEDDGIGTNPPKILIANIKKTYPEAIIYDSGAIEVQKTKITGTDYYHKYLDDVVLDDSYDATKNCIIPNSITTKFKNYHSKALSDPYDGRPNSTTIATYPYAKTSASNVLINGKVVFNVCVNIPNISKYIKTIDPGDNPSSPGLGDGDQDDFNGRLLHTNDTLRLVVFTDVSNHNIDNTMSSETKPEINIRFNIPNGECRFQSTSSDCTLCNFIPDISCSGDAIIFKYKSTSKNYNCNIDCPQDEGGDGGINQTGGPGGSNTDPCCACCPSSTDDNCVVGRCQTNREFLIEGIISKFDDIECDKFRFSYGIYVKGSGVLTSVADGGCGGIAQARPRDSERYLYPNFPDTRVFDIQRKCEFTNGEYLDNRVIKKIYPKDFKLSPPYDFPALYVDTLCNYYDTFNVFNNTWPPSWRYLSDYIEGCLVPNPGETIQSYLDPVKLLPIINKIIEKHGLEDNNANVSNVLGRFYDSTDQNFVINTPFDCNSNFVGISPILNKKLYIDDITYICIPMDSQVENVNNYEDCDGGAT